MNEVVEAAKAPGVFSLDKFLVNVAYPKETIKVHTDAYGVNELLKLRAERDQLEAKVAAAMKAKKDQKRTSRTVGGDDPMDTSDIEAELETLQVKIDEWIEKIDGSELTFELQGMPPKIVDTITKKHFVDPKADYTNTTEEEERDYELIGKSIICVTNAEGDEDRTPFDTDRVKELRGKLLTEEYHKIVAGVAHVNLNGALFDQATDASFLGRRTDVAGK
jgi:hypothetical protein